MRKAALVVATLLAIGFISGEIFLRQYATYVVDREAPKLRGVYLEQNPEALIYWSGLGRRLVPNAHVLIKNEMTSHRDVVIRTNSLGFRDRELAKPKPKTERRMLVLGDSITWAAYLPAEETYVEIAQKHLQEKIKTPSYELINAGVGDIGIVEEVAILKEKGLETEPDWVILAFYLNDSRPPWGFNQELGHVGWVRRHSLIAAEIYSRLRLQRFLKDHGQQRFRWIREKDRLSWKTDRKALDQLVELAGDDWGAAWKADSWPVIDENLSELERLSKKEHFRVAVVVFPVSYQVYADFLDDRPQQEITARAKHAGFAIHDFLPMLRTHRSEALYFDQCHPNEAGNQLIGRDLAEFLGNLAQ